MNKKYMMLVTVLATLIASSAYAGEDKWDHNIGTGLFTLNVDGDLGVGTPDGPLIVDASMSFSELQDVRERAYGL